VLVFCYCYWGLAPSAKPVAQGANSVPSVSKEPTQDPAQMTVQVPTASASGQALPQAPITHDREQIYDSPNVLASINKIRQSGSQDEKDWALRLLLECNAFLTKVPQTDGTLAAAPLPKPFGRGDNAELEAQRKAANDELLGRCKGVDQLTVADRKSLREALSQGHSANQSVLGQLQAIDNDRWSGAQAQLISDSLYSSDPIVARSAFFALLSSFDSNSAGGRDRLDAFTLALGPQFTGRPLSEFERLDACRTQGWCGGNWGSDENTTPRAAVTTLADKYRSAIASHTDARSILAIR